MNTPEQTLDLVVKSAETKVKIPLKRLVLLGLLAGAFIALAGAASTMASMNLLNDPETVGLGRLVMGFVFVGGLAMVILTGAELFTGNSLMAAGLLERRIKLRELLRNWSVVLLANLVGGFLIALLIWVSGLYSGTFGATTIKIAAGKTALDFLPALALGILCNFLVALAVLMATAAKSVSGKLLAVFFPILVFVVLGFEHSVANAYFIPAGLLANLDPALSAGAVSSEFLNLLGLLANLVPVILGNIIGGSLLIAATYSLALRNRSGAKAS